MLKKEKGKKEIKNVILITKRDLIFLHANEMGEMDKRNLIFPRMSILSPIF